MISFHKKTIEKKTNSKLQKRSSQFSAIICVREVFEIFKQSALQRKYNWETEAERLKVTLLVPPVKQELFTDQLLCYQASFCWAVLYYQAVDFLQFCFQIWHLHGRIK